MTIEDVLQLEESQTFERKSIHISPKALAVTLIAFANDFLLQIVVSNKNLSFGDRNLSFGDRNLSFGDRNLSFEILKERMQSKNYRTNTQENILKLYESIDFAQVFGIAEIKEILKCSSTTSKTIMNKLKNIDCIVPVKGQGKGKYLFQNVINKET